MLRLWEWSPHRNSLVAQWFRLPTSTAAAKSLQSCPTLCDPIDGSPPGSQVSGILQARTLEWVAISFYTALKWKVKMKSLSRIRLFTTPWTAAYQAPPSMGFSRQEYWSGVPSPSPSATRGCYKKAVIQEPGSMSLSDNHKICHHLDHGLFSFQINFCHLWTTQFMLFCHSSPNRLKQIANAAC